MKTHHWDRKYCFAAIEEVWAQKRCFAVTEEVTLIAMPSDVAKKERWLVMRLVVGTDLKSEKRHHLQFLEGRTSLLARKFACTC